MSSVGQRRDREAKINPIPRPNSGAKKSVEARDAGMRNSTGCPQTAAADRITPADRTCVPQTTTVRASMRSSSVTCGKVSNAWLALTAFMHREMVSLNIYQGIKPQSRNTAIPIP